MFNPFSPRPAKTRDAPELRFFKVPVPAGTYENVRLEPELFASHACLKFVVISVISSAYIIYINIIVFDFEIFVQSLLGLQKCL